jgi:hypothetical protein
LDPILLLDSDNGDVGGWAREKRKLWLSDPVHLTPEGYVGLLEGLMKAYTDLEFNRVSTGGGGVPAKTTEPPSTNRQSWVTEDDTTAHRNLRGAARWAPVVEAVAAVAAVAVAEAVCTAVVVAAADMATNGQSEVATTTATATRNRPAGHTKYFCVIVSLQ